MSGYPNQPPNYQNLYPQFYHPVNGAAPPQYPGAGYPGAPGGVPPMCLPSQHPYPQGAVPQPGFMVGQQAAMSYAMNPTPVVPSAPGYGYPGAPTVSACPQGYINTVEWVPTTPRDAMSLADRAIVAGYEGYDNSPLWVIRARFEGDLIPGKLAVKHHAAYVPWGGKENAVQNIEVCCARPDRVRWVESRDGSVPPCAVSAGHTAEGEALYVGRAREQGSLTPGKVHTSHKAMYMSFAGKEVAHRAYEVLCLAG